MKTFLCEVCHAETPKTSNTRKYCDACRKEVIRQQRAASHQRHAERDNAQSRKYQHEHREQVLAKKREVYHSNIEEIRRKDRERHQRDKEKRNALKLASYYAHREERLAEMAARYVANPEPVKARVKRWRQENPARANRNGQIKRARKRNAVGTHTTEDFWVLCEQYQWKCVYCGIKLTEKTATEDHATPLARGGSDLIDNILPACFTCNSRKSARTYDEYMQYLKRLL